MIQGLYSAATGMIAIEARQAVTANNIANAATPGFRRQTAVQRGFYQVFQSKMRHPFRFDVERGPGGGLRLVETFTDDANGVVTTTGDALHVALSGPGFIAVDTPQGERFTRNGKFAVSADGMLQTEDGLLVQAEGGGGINVAGGLVTIDADGDVRSDGALAGRIRVVEFEDIHLLSREGHNLFLAPEEALERSIQAVDTRVHHKAIEMSNVQTPYEMVQMMLGVRAYTANQRVINAIDETASKLIEQVGTPV